MGNPHPSSKIQKELEILSSYIILVLAVTQHSKIQRLNKIFASLVAFWKPQKGKKLLKSSVRFFSIDVVLAIFIEEEFIEKQPISCLFGDFGAIIHAF
jgi:hypothetical protein